MEEKFGENWRKNKKLAYFGSKKSISLVLNRDED